MKRFSKHDPQFDSTQLDRFKDYRDDHNNDLRLTLVRGFETEAAKSIEKLEAEIQGNENTFRYVAHNLKSTAALMGGMHLADTCETLEMETLDLATKRQMVMNAKKQFEQLKADLGHYCSKIKKAG